MLGSLRRVKNSETTEELQVKDLWRRREAELKEQLDLQLFDREAERIDTATKGHNDFLNYANLGDSVESVSNLLKRHGDLEAKLDVGLLKQYQTISF